MYERTVMQSNDTNQLVRLQANNIRSAAESIHAAFVDYPLCRHLQQKSNAKKKTLIPFFEYILYICVRNGLVVATSSHLEAVAGWLPYDQHTITAWKVLRSVPFKTLLGTFKIARKIKAVGNAIDDAHHRLAPCRHWYLNIIGVRPECQKKGHATRLIKAVLADLDEKRLPCYVDTLDPKNIPVYEHFGFRVLEQISITETNLMLTAMLRKTP